MSRRIIAIVVSFLFISGTLRAMDAEQLYYALRNKVMLVKDYTADVRMKIDVSFMRIPPLRGRLYFKAPDKMRMERSGGISILPRKNVNLTLRNLIPTGKVTVIDAGIGVIDGKKVRIIKVIPEEDQANIVLTKIWIDETGVLALRTETTTQNDGTVVMDLEYGRYINFALPDKVSITMDMKDYKLPKGITMDYSDTPQPPVKSNDGKQRKGVIHISYLDYAINTGLSDATFNNKE